MVFVRTKTIAGNEYYYLVESLRRGKRVVQRTVKYLGRKKPAFARA